MTFLVACAGAPVVSEDRVASGAPDAPDPAEAAAAQDRLAFDIAESLVTEVGPRPSGSSNDRRAIEWAITKLNVLGFEKVRAEPVIAQGWERGELKVELLGPAAREFDAVALGGSVGTPPGGIEAQLLAVPTVEALEQMAPAKVKGKVVFIANRMQRTRDGSGYTPAVKARRNGASIAGRKGAKALLIRSIGTDAGNGPHAGALKYEGTGPKIPAAALSMKEADALEQLLAGAPQTRVRMVVGSRDAGPVRTANVIGEIPGATGEIVLLAAHLDSWDTTPGANDDAAGVGIVIAAAHRLAPTQPRRTIRVVLFANEEHGLAGAKAYAQAHAAEAAQHAVMMEADSGSGAVWRINGGLAAADWPWAVDLARSLRLEAGANDKEGHADISELRKLGVPEIIPTHDATAYFDVHHTRDDTLDTIDRDGIKQATDVFATLAQAAANRPEPFGRAPILKKK